jgi:biofilm PGA synthesis lipoprotein PgaB
MRFVFVLFFVSTLLLASHKNSYKVLCYHNVVDKITDTKIMNITTKQLIEHFKWLKVNNYHVITIDGILKARSGIKDLPKNAVLLTFDDGYKSFYTRVFPLLKLYNYHAIFALVGKWQDTPLDKDFLYGTIKRPRELLLNKNEIMEMANSGLVEFASHSYDAHHGIPANPQGNTQPPYSTLKYDKRTKSYESVNSYMNRVSDDIKRSSEAIYTYTGKYPRIMVWPYGAYTKISQKLAQKHGMPIALTLDDGINYPKNISSIKRILISSNPSFSEFYWAMQNKTKKRITPEHSLFIDMDEIYHPNPKITNKRLGVLIEKIRKLKVSTIILKAYSDLDEDGYADSLYFPNHILPVRDDLLNRVAWQLQRRADIEDVYIQMPLYCFEKNDKPFSIKNKKDQKEIYAIYYELSKQSSFKGIFFDNSKDMQHIQVKSAIKFTKELYKSIRHFSADIKTALMINSKKFIYTDDKTAKELLKSFTFVYIDAKPSLDEFSKLCKKTANTPLGLQKAVIVINENENSNKNIVKQMEQLLKNRIINIGYRPILFIDDKKYADLIEIFSLKKSVIE